MDGDSSDQSGIDDSGDDPLDLIDPSGQSVDDELAQDPLDPNYNDSGSSGDGVGQTFTDTVGSTLAQWANDLGGTNSGTSSVTSAFAAIPLWAWLALGALVVVKVAR